MTTIINLLKISRPVNLAIVISTMYVLRFFIIKPIIASTCLGMKLQMSEFDFFISVMVVVLLTAAGNIINDYFDVKVDKINKPDRVLIGTKVKRRVAMVAHQSMNILAVLLSVYLCMKFDSWKPLAIPVSIATLLWFYSPFFKKQIFIGNLVVAFCVSIVPIWTGVFEIPEILKEYGDVHSNPKALQSTLWLWILAYSCFAFLLSLSREALKDLEDLMGDTQGKYHTMPIAIGEKWTRFYAAALMTSCLFAVGFVFTEAGLSIKKDVNASVFTLILVILPGTFTIMRTLSARSKNHYSVASLLAKTTMAGGIILCLLAGTYLWSC